MQFLYIDESGTNTIEHADKFPYFIISMVHVFDKDKLKKVIKKYISKNYADSTGSRGRKSRFYRGFIDPEGNIR